MKLSQGESICIVTCALPDYECPDQTTSRCACPPKKPILKDVDKGTCVQALQDCPPANSYILPKDGLEKFELIDQPVDTVKKEGESIRMLCTVAGTTKYQYFWYKSDALATGQHSITNSDDAYLIQAGKEYLDISNLKASDAGYYHCRVKSNDKYALISNSGYLRVEYYTEQETVKKDQTASKGTQFDTLNCNVPQSEPPAEITWYKDGEKVSDLRMFTVPDDQGSKAYPKGTLYIMNIVSDDVGVYECKALYNMKEYLLTRVNFAVNGFVSQPTYGPNIVAVMSGRSKVGSNAIFYCAGAGKPAPIVRWNKEDGSRIDSSDSIFLEDYKRKLTIGNIRESQERAYHCTVSNDQGEDRKSILYLTIEPASYDITFIAKPQSHIIYPNKYTPFMLECAIAKEGSPVMYWLKNGAILGVSNQRIITNTTTGVVNGKTVRNTTLHFVTPNESDQGVYQCIVENKEQMRQATAYINVRKGSEYDIDGSPKKYYAHDKPMPISDAESYCAQWQKNGHLVSIMNQNESEIVFGLMKEKNITQAWIGLTSEDDHSPGYWKWTQPGVPSTSFSYWYQGNPNNLNGNENYAIMDISKSGRWYDVDNLSKDYPFVCKHYTSTCPSVSQFFNESAVPISMMETSTTRYGVGETVTVTCSEDTVKLQEILTCTSRGDFMPSALACPVRNAGLHVLYSSVLILLTALFTLT